METVQVLDETKQQEVRDELERLLESAPFRASKRCREFLQFIIEKTLSGPNGSLKERAIGVDLFGLPHDFDTSQHTIVRVTASETRKKLAQYYQALNGSHHSVRIYLPAGSYNAEFIWTGAPSVVLAAEPALPRDLNRTPYPISRRWWLAGGGVAGLIITAASAWRMRPGRSTGERSPVEPVAGPVPTRTIHAHGVAPAGTVRIGAGLKTPYLDRNGQSWDVDRYYSGGSVLSRSAERVARTLDPDLYRRVRVGEFRYDIPLDPGTYEMRLHFAETGLSDFISAESSGEGQRVFRVTANGNVLLNAFDVVADAAGTNIADERVFRDIEPAADGMLHLEFSPMRGSAMVSGIELISSGRGEALPLRVRSGWPTAWRDESGALWRADSYFMGGNALVRRTNPARESEAHQPDTALFASERWGHFSYSLPVSDGRYSLTLRFCEGHLGPLNTGRGGVGGRIFDVFCNGVALLRDFDIVKEAGGEGRPLKRVFSGMTSNAQGKIVLTFIPKKGMACVNAIEVARQ